MTNCNPLAGAGIGLADDTCKTTTPRQSWRGVDLVVTRSQALVRVTFIPVRLLWERLERVLWWWARQGPFEGICVFVPWVVLGDALSLCQGPDQHTNEE